MRSGDIVQLNPGHSDAEYVRNRRGKVKTRASGRPVPLNEVVGVILNEWRELCPYSGDDDFLFPSVRLNWTRSSTLDTVPKKIIRWTLAKAGIKRKVIGWHSFRHSLATNLHALGVDPKVMQELLRHASSRITMDVYTSSLRGQASRERKADCDADGNVKGLPYRSLPSNLETLL